MPVRKPRLVANPCLRGDVVGLGNTPRSVAKHLGKLVGTVSLQYTKQVFVSGCCGRVNGCIQSRTIGKLRQVGRYLSHSQWGSITVIYSLSTKIQNKSKLLNLSLSTLFYDLSINISSMILGGKEENLLEIHAVQG